MTHSYTPEQLQERYGKSQKEHFWVRETIGFPHPYCITPKHIKVAADYHSGILSQEAIRDAEANHHASCGICRSQLSFEEHESALLVACQKELKQENGRPN